MNRLTRFARTNATDIDYIITNTFLEDRSKNIKTELSDHFPTFLITGPTTLNIIKKTKKDSLKERRF